MDDSTNPYVPAQSSFEQGAVWRLGPATPPRLSRPGHWLPALLSVLFAVVLLGSIVIFQRVQESRGAAEAIVQITRVPPFVFPWPDLAPSPEDEFERFRNTQEYFLVSQQVLSAALGRTEVAQLPMIRAHADPVEWLQDHLEVELRPQSEYMVVRLRGRDREQCAAIVNAVVREYLDRTNGKEQSDRNARIDSLRITAGQSRSVLDAKEKGYHELRKTVGEEFADESADVARLEREVEQLRKHHERIVDALLRAEVELRAADRVNMVQEAFGKAEGDQ